MRQRLKLSFRTTASGKDHMVKQLTSSTRPFERDSKHTSHRWAYCLILQKSSHAAQRAHVRMKHMHTAASAKHTGLTVHEKLMCTCTEASTRGMHFSCFTKPGQVCTRKMQRTYVNCRNTNCSLALSEDLRSKNPKGRRAENLPPGSLTLEHFCQQELIEKQSALQQVLFRQRFLCLPPHRRNTRCPRKDSAK